MFLQKKIASIIFPILWFIVVGLRYEVGTDWYPTLELFDRAVLNAKSFNSYQLVDTEILWKIVATVSESFKISKSYIFIFIGFVEALLIFHLIKISENYRLAIVGITSVFLFFFL